MTEETEKTTNRKNKRPRKLDLLFEELFELEPETAFKLEDEMKHEYRNIISRMLKQGVLVCDKEDDQLYFFVREKSEKFVENQNKRIFMIIVSIVIPAILFFLLGLAWVFTAV